MSEDLKPNEATQETAVSRREFGAVSLAAGLAVVAGARGAEAAERPLTETEVIVKTPDGNCDAAFIHPTTGTYPGVLIWPDAFGLRPAMRQFARRIAADGYSVLVPNPFYRTAKAPVFDNPASFNFDNPEDRAKLPPLTAHSKRRARRRRTRSLTWRFSMPRRRSTRRRRSGRRAIAWAVPWSSERPRRLRIASAPARPSTVAAW